jgi:acylphosphatase
MDSLHILVKGKVQGVGFRYFVLNQANTLKITGWVRNLPDGSVESLGIGPKESLERFLQALKAGPIGSRVEQCGFQWLTGQKPLSNFEIRS